MLITIENLLSQKQLEQIEKLFNQAEFRDGKLTAGTIAGPVKNNLQMDASDACYNQLNNLIIPSLISHPDYLAACWPAKLMPPYYVRYQSGMKYGEHVDNPIMSEHNTLRTDISMTIFLSSPEEYEGGELSIVDAYETKQVKLTAGSIVLYPSFSRHFVAPVTSGERRVAVTWLQSRIRDPAKRQILFELHQAKTQLSQMAHHKRTAHQITNVFNNLVRHWIDI